MIDYDRGNNLFKMKAIDLLLSLAYMYIFEIIIKCYVSQYENFLLWEHLRRNLGGYAWCPIQFKCESEMWFLAWWNYSFGKKVFELS